MGRLYLLLLTCCAMVSSYAQNPDAFSRVRIPLTATVGLQDIARTGVPIDHATIHHDYIITTASTFDRQQLQAAGITFAELPAVSPASQQKESEFLSCSQLFNDTIMIPDQFNYGSMGSMLTYDELLDELDSMVQLYPGLISVKQSIDTFRTHEGRPLYYVKISDNPNTDESSVEQQVLYTGLHHAREPISMMQLVFYMQYLLENYGQNEQVDYIVNNLELYFVPCINPDGYIYNQTTNPNGGGLWRKNRRDNQDGTFGVDLNRNYGENWGANDVGSSPITGSSTYRGPAPFSEEETRAIAYLCENNNFKAALNYHAFSNVLIYPDGYEQDSLRYVSFADHLTRHNHYTFGTGEETLGYPVNGDSDAWMYNEEVTKNKQYSFTPEVGNVNDGFWPDKSRIIPLCQDNLLANLNAALLVGDYMDIREISDFSTPRSGSLELDIRRIGLGATGMVEVTLLPGSDIVSHDGPVMLGSFSDMQSKTATINFELDPSLQEGTLITFELELTLDNVTQTKTIQKVFNTQPPIFADRFDVNLTNWQLGQWGSTNEYAYSGSFSITDSPYSTYLANFENTLELDKQIDLTNPKYVDAFIKFYARWDIENGFDYAQVIVNDGFAEHPMCGNYTNNGVGFTGQPDGEPLYDGTQTDWVEEYISLKEFLGSVISIDMKMVSDNAVEKDGMYIDNFRIYAVKERTVGVGEDKLINGLKVFPNPATEQVSIMLTEGVHQIQIINAQGRVVMHVDNARNRISVPVSTLNSGMYTVVATDSRSGNVSQAVFIRK